MKEWNLGGSSYLKLTDIYKYMKLGKNACQFPDHRTFDLKTNLSIHQKSHKFPHILFIFLIRVKYLTIYHKL